MKRNSLYIILLFFLSLSSPSYGDIYSWTDEKGVRHFSNTSEPRETKGTTAGLEDSEQSDDNNMHKPVSRESSEHINELRDILKSYSKINDKLEFTDLVEAEWLLSQVKKTNIIKKLTHNEKIQVENVSVKVEEVKEGLTDKQMVDLKQAVAYINAKWEQDQREDLTPSELSKLDKLLRSKWNNMIEALSQNKIEEAVSYFYKSKRDVYRKMFYVFSPEKRSKIAQDLNDIRLVSEMGNSVEYDIGSYENGKVYSHQLLFVKDIDGEWYIFSF